MSSAAQSSRYIVVFQPNTINAAAVTATVERQYDIRNVRHRYEQAIQGFAADLSPAQLQALTSDPRVSFVEPDGIMTTTATQNNPPSWGLDRIDQRNLPLDQAYTYPSTASGVHFYGIDTGILYTHPDFGGRASAGADFVVPSTGAVDCDGHGTHTASTAAGATYGVAKGATIVGVRVLDCFGSGFTSGVIAGVDWVRINGIQPAVANMSLGGGFSQALNNAVANAIASGIVFSLSAGNSNANACNSSPASTPTALTVGSTTITDGRSSFSNFGTCVDIFAPGSGILAAYIPSGTATLSGTSMAAPHVAGAAALYLQANPNDTPAQVAAALVNNATNGAVGNPGTGSPNKLLYMGFIGGGGPANQPPVAVPTATCTPSAFCTFDGTGSTDDVGVTQYEWRGPSGTVISTEAIFTRQFNSTAQRTFTLVVFDGGGLSDSEDITFLGTPPANQPPVASFTFSCSQLACAFDGTGSTDDVGVVSYGWNFGDNSTGTGATPNHTYGAAGTYTVALTVTDAGNLMNTATQQVTVTAGGGNQAPVAVPAASCTPSAFCTFDATGSTDDVGITQYEWRGPSGTVISTEAIFTRQFNSTAERTFTLVVFDGGGLSDSEDITFLGTPPANQPPVASFTFSCSLLACAFDGTGSSDDVGVVSYSWDFGDNSTGTGATANHTFGAAGTYTVALTVTDAGNLMNTTSQQVTVNTGGGNQPPVAVATANCVAGGSCTFDATGSTDDNGITAYEWRGPSGTLISTEAVFSRQFNSPNTRTYTLTVFDAAGLSNTTTLNFTSLP